VFTFPVDFNRDEWVCFDSRAVCVSQERPHTQLGGSLRIAESGGIQHIPKENVVWSLDGKVNLSCEE